MVTLYTVLIAAGIGLVLLLALWPSPDRAVRLLRRWGVPEPDEVEQSEALRYLRRRRLVYPAAYTAFSAGTALFAPRNADAGGLTTILLCLVAGAVVGELLAQRPPQRARREASLDDRGVRDLLSLSTIGAWAAVVAVTVGVPLLQVLGVPLGLSDVGLPLGVALAATAAGLLVVALAVRRPPARLDGADAALRLRSARVGAGLAMASAGLTSTGWDDAGPAIRVVGLVVAVVGIVGWRWTVLPVRPASAPAER